MLRVELQHELLDSLTCWPQDGKAGAPTVAASTLGLLVDLLCFCVQHHQYRVKYYILRSDTVGKVLRLLRRREKWLVVAALRFLRTCIGLKVWQSAHSGGSYSRTSYHGRRLLCVLDVDVECGCRLVI